MPQLLVFNKPFNVLSQFTDSADRQTLSAYLPDFPGYYPAGRLDYDSEGLLLLTDNGTLQNRIAHPSNKMAKTYWAQVEGTPDSAALTHLAKGVQLKDGITAPAKATLISPPELWERNPPIRHRINVPTSWLELTITEGRNRQVRRMTAAAGFPTLRLVRVQIGPWCLDELQPGEHRLEQVHLTTQKTSRH
ncbi:MAG: pseudouridine synthase [Cellvibrionaceae bacterium]|nr:pseudouridine synthase [Cellvibrionaceae bacterium]